MNIEKRVKRHVWSQEHRFLITCPAALAPLCMAELAEMGLEGTIESDGIRLRGKLETAYRILICARTASRLWLTLPDFKAGAQEELFRKTNRIFWELLISPDIPIAIDARVRRSRIEHEGESAATALKAIRHRFVEQGLPAPRGLAETAPSDEERQRIRLLAANDRAELLIDLTGEHLHRRGYRRAFVEAPLRETLAAGVVLWGLDQWRRRYPGRRWPERIHDPFCGSGTIPIEAALLASNLPPGGQRDFLTMQQPTFREAAFNHIRRELLQAAAEPEVVLSGADISSTALAAARENASAAGCGIGFTEADAFSEGSAGLPGDAGLVITNPPYGDRLPEGGVELYRRLFELLDTSGTPGVVVIPESLLPRLKLPGNSPRLRLDNGGIRVRALYYQR